MDGNKLKGVYEPLDRSLRQIRLLELHPGVDDEPVSGRLLRTTVPLSLAVRFGTAKVRARVYPLVKIVGGVLRPVVQVIFGAYRTFYHSGFSKPTETFVYFKDKSNVKLVRFGQSIARAFAKFHHFHETEQNLACKEGIEKAFQLALEDSHVGILEESLDKFVPRFEAISYCWGKGTDKRTMLLNGVPFNVPASAVTALQDVRFEHDRRFIWIDAICINQNDITERQDQILLMRDVYSCGERTIIWLGVEDNLTSHAMDMLSRIERANVTDSEAVSSRGEENDSREALEPIVAPDNLSVETLLPVFCRPWFARVWVYQEILSSQECCVLIGRHEVNWIALECAAALYIYNHPRVDDETKVSLEPATFMCMARWSDFQESGENGLRKLLESTCKLQSSEPRDKIYAVLGLTHWAQNGDDIPRLLQPNYVLPPRVCSAYATKTMIQEESGLLALAPIGTYSNVIHNSMSEDRHWPSWCPHWHQSERVRVSKFAGYFRADNGRPLMATDKLQSEDPHVLELGGFAVDKVKYVSSMYWICPRSPITEWIPSDTLRRMAEAVQCQLHLSGPISYEVLITVLTGGKPIAGWDRDYMEQDEQPTVHELVQQMLTTVKNQSDALDMPTWKMAMDSNKTPEIIRSIETHLYRAIFVTESGHLGLGPPTVLPGDTIAILFGGPWPFILDRQTDHWRLRGPCYVHGIMEGEAVVEREADRMEPEIFELR